MKSIIKNGITLIEMPPQPKRENKKTGVLGTWIASNGRYKAEFYYCQKKYHLGSHKTIEGAKIMRETAEAKAADGTFLEWYAATFPPKENKYGVMGLSYRKDRNKYNLQISLENRNYTIGEYETIEEAAPIRLIAEKHKENGNLLEWLSEYRKQRKLELKNKKVDK